MYLLHFEFQQRFTQVENLKYYTVGGLMYYQAKIMDLAYQDRIGVQETMDGKYCTYQPTKDFVSLDFGSALLSESNELVGICSYYQHTHGEPVDISMKVYIAILPNHDWITDTIRQHSWTH